MATLHSDKKSLGRLMMFVTTAFKNLKVIGFFSPWSILLLCCITLFLTSLVMSIRGYVLVASLAGTSMQPSNYTLSGPRLTINMRYGAIQFKWYDNLDTDILAVSTKPPRFLVDGDVSVYFGDYEYPYTQSWTSAISTLEEKCIDFRFYGFQYTEYSSRKFRDPSSPIALIYRDITIPPWFILPILAVWTTVTAKEMGRKWIFFSRTKRGENPCQRCNHRLCGLGAHAPCPECGHRPT